jgi:hypothetical protein
MREDVPCAWLVRYCRPIELHGVSDSGVPAIHRTQLVCSTSPRDQVAGKGSTTISNVVSEAIKSISVADHA